MGSGLKQSSPQPPLASDPSSWSGQPRACSQPRSLGGLHCDTFLQASVSLRGKQAFQTPTSLDSGVRSSSSFGTLSLSKVWNAGLETAKPVPRQPRKLCKGEPLVRGTLRLHTHASSPLRLSLASCHTYVLSASDPESVWSSDPGSLEGPSSCSKCLTA